MIWEVIKIIIESYHEADLEITNLRLQKILYFIQERVAHDLGRRAFYDKMEAWTYGPVFPNVYKYYSLFGRNHISEIIHDDMNVKISDDIQTIIDAEIQERKSMSTWQLVKESHKQGGVWANITNNGEVIEYQIIPFENLLQ